MNDKHGNDHEGVEILPPHENDSTPQESSVHNHNNLLAIFADSYTDRPDLLIAEIEKHDPGFVRRMNAASESDAAELRQARFKFGKHQAYTALAVSVVGAFALLIAVLWAVQKGASFWTIISLGLVYAITQGGTGGFNRLIEACSDLIRRLKGESKDENDPPADGKS